MTPQSSDEGGGGGGQRRSKSSLSTSSSSTASSVSSSTSDRTGRPINTKLLIQLAQDFGADERAAAALVAKSATIVAAPISPIFTADASPDEHESSSHQSIDHHHSHIIKRKPIVVANKDKKSRQQPSDHYHSSSSHDRLLQLQKILMTLNDASMTLRIAHYIRQHTKLSALNDDGTILEFDLCLLNSSVIDHLYELCG